MNPDNSNPSGGNSGKSDSQTQHDAAADVIRNQIDNLYDSKTDDATVVEENPYERTHDTHPKPQADQWKEYHTAWQNYYQKYYENYYTAQSAAAQTTEEQPKTSVHEGYFAYQSKEEPVENSAEVLSNDQALLELRSKLRGRIQASAEKIRKSRHFIPIISAIAIVLIFSFIQYNQVIVANVMAYVSPGSISQQDIVIDPKSDVAVTQDPKLIIPKINVDVPVAYDVGNDYNSQMAAMANGLAWFGIPGADSHPGEIGNTVLAGHSSNDLFDTGAYKFIFAQLEKLTVGDTVYANYKGIRYTYVVTKTQVVAPNDVSALVYPTTKPVITLLTCTPLGTALNRLLVTAEQVSPDPSAATVAPPTKNTATTTSIPGDSGNLFTKLFGGGK